MLSRKNLNGPSVVSVPDWVQDPMGKYYMYFSDHKGKFIDFSYSDKPDGPFTVAQQIKPMELHTNIKWNQCAQ